MFVRRSYTDGPTESQKLYGSHLPPPLRWGAARKYASGRDENLRYNARLNTAAGAFSPGNPAFLGDDGWAYRPRRPTARQQYSSGYNMNLDSNAYWRQDTNGLYRTRSMGRAPKPIVNVYNDVYQGQDAHVPIPTYPSALPPAVPNAPPASHDFENRHRDRRRSDRVRMDLAEELAEMRMERRLRSRSHDRRNARPSKSDTDTSVVVGASGEGTGNGGGGASDNVFGGDEDELTRALNSEMQEDDAPGEPDAEKTEDSDDSVNDDGIKPDTAAEASQTWEPFSFSDYDEWATRPRRPADRKRHSQSKYRPPHREKLRRDSIDPPEYLQGYRSSSSRANSPRSEISAESYRTSAPRVSTPWFLESWNVRAAKGLNVQDIRSKQTSSAPSTIVTELSSESLARVETKPTAPSAAYNIRPRAYGRHVPSINPMLKRVVYATYGDLLQSEALKGADPPGFVAVSQNCGSQGDTLYHIL